jgi:hypothetical protein
MKIDKKERNVLIGMLIVLTLWFVLFLDKFYDVANGNSKLFYFIFLFAYSYLISKFFFNDGNFKAVLIFLIVLIISDVLLPPYILTKSAAPVLADNLKFSSDYFIYSLMPSGWNHLIKYYMTYIGFPIFMWSILALLFDRKKFMSLLKSGA